MTHRSIRRAALFVTFAACVAGASGPALADGMPVVEQPKVHHVRPHHHVRHHGGRHRLEQPMIGSIIKHQHDNPDGAVYAMPAWPSCRYVLNTSEVRTPHDGYTGQFDCGQ